MTTDMKACSTTLVPLAAVRGDDPDDTRMLRKMGEDAIKHVEAMPWCRGVKESYFGTGVGGLVAAFLLRINPEPGADEWLWAVSGDVPNAYLVPDRSPTAEAALATYCELMSDWVAAVRLGKGVSEAFPVAAPPTSESADALATRIAFIRRELLAPGRT